MGYDLLDEKELDVKVWGKRVTREENGKWKGHEMAKRFKYSRDRLKAYIAGVKLR